MSVFLCVRRLCCHDLSHVALTSVRASGFRGLWGFLSGDSWGLYFSLTQHLFHINRNFIFFFNLQSSCPTTATLSCPCIVKDPQNRTGLLFLEPYSFFVILLALTSLSHSATLTGFIGLNKACVGRILIKVTLEVSVWTCILSWDVQKTDELFCQDNATIGCSACAYGQSHKGSIHSLKRSYFCH